jgi:hypothetical protein
MKEVTGRCSPKIKGLVMYCANSTFRVRSLWPCPNTNFPCFRWGLTVFIYFAYSLMKTEMLLSIGLTS